MLKRLTTFNVSRGFTIVAFAGIWLAACLASWHIDNSGFVHAMMYVWSATIFLLPLSFAIAGALLLKSPLLNPSNSQFVRVLLSAAIIASALLGYAMCVGVLGRISAVWWEHVKFGGDSISLGKSAAELFLFITIAAGSAAFALHRFALVGARMAFLSRAAFGLILGAALLYFLLALSPYAQWRA